LYHKRRVHANHRLPHRSDRILRHHGRRGRSAGYPRYTIGAGRESPQTVETDVCVYGATPGASWRQSGSLDGKPRSSSLAGIGGMTASGLSRPTAAHAAGISREFYKALGPRDFRRLPQSAARMRGRGVRCFASIGSSGSRRMATDHAHRDGKRQSLSGKIHIDATYEEICWR
jgi:hypothetical protein